MMDIKKRAEEIKELYKQKRGFQTFSALVMGEYGAGKTYFACTGRKPILIDMFDPKGIVTIEQNFKEEIEKGEILIRMWIDELSSKPKVYKEWDRQWQEDIRTGFLSHFGTYVIDSYTTLQDALANYIGATAEGSKKLPVGALAQSDYQPLYATVKDIIKISQTQDCDFILTAHLVVDKDELTGEIKAEIDAFKRMKSRVPLLFSEKYVIEDRLGKHVLLTQSRGRFRASTSLGSGKLEPVEEPNIKKILEKVGLPTEDKPSLFEVE